MFVFFFFKQKTAYEMRISDWSSDVCSSDLLSGPGLQPGRPGDDLGPGIEENPAFGRRDQRRAFVVGDADGEGATLPRPFDGGDRIGGGAAGGDTQQDVVRAARRAVHLPHGRLAVDLRPFA